MDIMEKINGKKQGAQATTTPALDGRERLHFFAGELAKANEAVVEIEGQVHRLAKVIRDADAAHAALQSAVSADGGVALAAYAAGEAPDGAIAELITREETTAKAAAAKVALPKAQENLAAAQAEVDRLLRGRESCVTEYLKMRADALARTYLKAFRLLVRTHDQLTGVSIALSAGNFGGDIAMQAAARIEVPRFKRALCTFRV